MKKFVLLFFIMTLSVVILFVFFLNKPDSRVDVLSQGYSLTEKTKSDSLDASPVEQTLETTSSTSDSIVFVGDVMLSRFVEKLMQANGSIYPHQGFHLSSLGADAVVGNFEGAVPEVHVPTPSGAFRFSVSVDYLPALVPAAFTHFSLANNHALDFGVEGLLETHRQLQSFGFRSFGHPVALATTSISYIELKSRKVALIAIHTLFAWPTDKDLQGVIKYAKETSDWQIVYVHWGNEYIKTPSDAQRQLATKLVSLGVDLIVGHHPHVVQAIEEINGVVVFYSLGNYIFDQYFDPAVQEGLVLTLTFNDKQAESIDLLPVTSRYSRSQPRLMSEDERQVVFKNLSSISSEALKEQIASGTIHFKD